VNLGDLGDGDAERLAFAIEVKLDGFWIYSGRFLFNDFKVVESNIGGSVCATPGSDVVSGGGFTLRAGVAAETGAWSDAMGY
jgi:hypothetical protein